MGFFPPFTNIYFFPAGIRKTSGMASKSTRPKDKKVTLKPLARVELKWRIIVTNEIPIAAPTNLNIPRSPVIVDTLSGISSMQALLEAGRAIPIPRPVIIIKTARVPATPRWIPIIRMKWNVWSPRRRVENEIIINPQIIGHRYPTRLSSKLVMTEAGITARERGVNIIPLANVDKL